MTSMRNLESAQVITWNRSKRNRNYQTSDWKFRQSYRLVWFGVRVFARQAYLNTTPLYLLFRNLFLLSINNNYNNLFFWFKNNQLKYQSSSKNSEEVRKLQFTKFVIILFIFHFFSLYIYSYSFLQFVICDLYSFES